MSQIICKTILGELTFDRIARTSHPGPVRTSALDHESFDHAVEDQSVIEPFVYQGNEILHCIRRDLRIEFCFMISPFSISNVTTGLAIIIFLYFLLIFQMLF
mgnify:CR=1 FL=1